MGDNQLQGPLPTELSSLLDLEQLLLQNNQLTGQVPAELGALENLRRLELSGNPSLNGIIPTELCALTVNVTVDCTSVSCDCSDTLGEDCTALGE